MSDAFTLDIQVGATGAQPTPPQVIWNNLLAYIAANTPGYTALPGALVEDILSTDTPAVVLLDSAAVDLINSLTSDSANTWLLTKLGALFGVPQGLGSNTSVYVTFTGTVGFPIPKGFTVGDGTYQYVVQDGGSIATGGDSLPLFCVATQAGTWAVPADTVTTLVTSVPGGITLSCTNISAGTPGAGAQTEGEYRAQVMQAQRAAATGFPSLLKTLLAAIPNVQPRLISVVQINGGGWEVICGGGDPYLVAYAIFQALFDISSLVGSTIAITGITNANPGVVTTNLNHGLITGQNNVHIAGVTGMSGVNGGPYTVTVITEKTFSFGVDTTSSGAWASGGVVTPNSRNVSVSINDYPNTYTVPFVNPPQQTVTVALTWNTNSPNYVSPTAVSQLVIPAVVNYVNSIVVGQPINLFELNGVFQAAVAPLIPIQFVDRLVWTISINGIVTGPASGTGLISGDPESFFECVASGVVFTQG